MQDSILKALYQFLTSDDELLDDVRQEGREILRERVGSIDITHDFRPRGAGPAALVLTRRGGLVHKAVASPLAIESPMVAIHIYARDTDELSSSEVIEEVQGALRDLLLQYNGLMGTRQVQTVDLESEPISAPIHPEDAKLWTRHYILTFMIGAEREVPTGAN